MIIFRRTTGSAASIGGNTASTINLVMGTVFYVSGFVNLALLDTQANFLAFHLQNVMFSFAVGVVGVMLVFFGAYGRVSSGLPHDNPYWRTRHPEAEMESGGRPVAALGASASSALRARASSAPASAPQLPGTTTRAPQ